MTVSIKMWRIIAFVSGVLLSQVHGQTDFKDVSIQQGLVRGYRDPAYNVFGFYDIPYATASKRFQAPDPPPSWNGTFEAVRRGIMCPQPSPFMLRGAIIMQEDCLVAHIVVPNTTETNLPVMVNVHGGAFQFGEGITESYRALVQEKNVISVSFNYRLGVLGFLCLGTKEAPGNAGLKDLLALLRWVKGNVASFGGNPDDVTIRGCSAGSALVDILTLSKTTDGLFHKAMGESGAHLGTFAVQADPIQNAKTIARSLNFTDVEDLTALQEFYQNAPLELLSSRVFSGNRRSGVYFSPCVERDLGQEAILLEPPYSILKAGEYVRYPTVYGFTDIEGMIRIPLFNAWRDEMNEDFSSFLPADLQFESEDEKQEVARKVKEFYFGNQTVNEATILSYIDYFTDVLFAYSMMRSVKMHAAAGDFTFYLYEYTFTDNNTTPIPYTNVTGAEHCDQRSAVLDENEANISEEYRNMKRIMRELWGNFVRTGVPVPVNSTIPAWPPTNGSRTPYMDLGSTVTLGGTPIEQRALFWDSIYEKYYREPIPPAHDAASAIKSVYLIYVFIVTFLLS